MLATMEELSRLVADFREKFRLSKAKAAEILGVSIVYVRSLEAGVDVRTGNEFEPRESTLRQIAARMSEFGYPVTYEDLMVAAGKITPAELEFHRGIAVPPTDEELAHGEFKIPGLSDLAASSKLRWEDLSVDERRQVWNVMEAAGKAVVEQMLAGKKQRKLR